LYLSNTPKKETSSKLKTAILNHPIKLLIIYPEIFAKKQTNQPIVYDSGHIRNIDLAFIYREQLFLLQLLHGADNGFNAQTYHAGQLLSGKQKLIAGKANIFFVLNKIVQQDGKATFGIAVSQYFYQHLFEMKPLR
jgi:hypothetical protein